jgi:hypothetical protein
VGRTRAGVSGPIPVLWPRTGVSFPFFIISIFLYILSYFRLNSNFV